MNPHIHLVTILQQRRLDSFFFESINRFLSKPIFTATQLVDDIISKLKDVYLFPSTKIESRSQIVSQEISELHPEALPYLISKLLEQCNSASKITAKNAKSFIVSLAFLKEDKASELIKNSIIVSKSSDAEYSSLILRVISANGELVSSLDSAGYERLKAIIDESFNLEVNTKSYSNFTHPSTVLSSILSCNDEQLVIEQFEEQLVKVLEKFIFSPSLLKSISGKPSLLEMYVNEACKQAGSYTFSISNNFADNISKSDEILSKLLSPEEAFKIILNIFQSASHGSYDSQSLVSSKFSSIPFLNEKIAKYIEEKEEQAITQYREITHNDTEDFNQAIKTVLLD